MKGERYKLEVAASTPEVFYTNSERNAWAAARSWRSRGISVTLTDQKTKRVLIAPERVTPLPGLATK